MASSSSKRLLRMPRSAVRDRERYIEDKTGASQLKESEFVCFYASENTRSKVHKYVALRSPHLRKYITSTQCCSPSVPQDILLPDVSQRHLDAALRFLSTGYLVGSDEDYASLRRILVEYFGIGGVPATLAEEGDGFEAVGDPGDDHECPLGCEESMPRARLWPHVARELDDFCAAAEPDVEHARNVKCAVCKININYNQGPDDAANMAIVREHYRDHHRRLKKHIFNTTGHKVDETVDEPDDSEEDNPHLPPVKRERDPRTPKPGPKSSKTPKKRKTVGSGTAATNKIVVKGEKFKKGDIVWKVQIGSYQNRNGTGRAVKEEDFSRSEEDFENTQEIISAKMYVVKISVSEKVSSKAVLMPVFNQSGSSESSRVDAKLLRNEKVQLSRIFQYQHKQDINKRILSAVERSVQWSKNLSAEKQKEHGEYLASITRQEEIVREYFALPEHDQVDPLDFLILDNVERDEKYPKATTSSQTPAIPKLRLNLAASGLKTSIAGPSTSAAQVSPPAAAPSPTPAAEQTRSPTEEAALEPVRGGGIALRFKPSVVDQAKATMTSAPPTKISIMNSLKEPTVPDKPKPPPIPPLRLSSVAKLPPVPPLAPLAPITPWADRQRPSSGAAGGTSGGGDKSNEKSRHSSGGGEEGRSRKRLKKKGDRKRSRSRERLLDSDEDDEVREITGANATPKSVPRRTEEDEELKQPPKKKRKAVPRKQCNECPARVPFNEMKKHAVTHCLKWWDKDGIEMDPNTGTWNCNQSGCDSFQESREDLISHLALYHNQLDHKMEAKKKNINAFYSACDDKGKAEDMTRVNPSPAKGKQGADERSSDKVTGEDKNPSEDTETISSSSGSVAPMKDEAAISRFLDDVLCSTDSND